jgi:signal transduction histidine kinase
MSEFIDGVNNVSIYLINGKQAVLKAYKGYPDNYIKKVKIIPYPKGTTWKTIIDGRPRYVKDTSNDRVLGTAGKDLGTKSYLSIPIKFKRKTIGCININSLNFNAFSNDELTLLGKVSKQIEASIKNAQQADDLEKSKYELKLARDNLELKVAERTSDLRALTAHIQNIREEERKQISREIHDELGQSLTNLKLDLFWLNKSIKGINGGNKAVVFKQVNLMTKKIDTSIKTVRKIATQLRPSVLDNLGLVAAIKWQLKEFQTMTSLDCEFKEYIKTLNVPQDLSTTIFRILQESLTNIARHSEAKKVVVKLKKDKKILILEVEDNGIGFDDKVFTNSKSLGLLGMKERATILGGDFKIQSQKSNGTKTILKLPI